MAGTLETCGNSTFRVLTSHKLILAECNRTDRQVLSRKTRAPISLPSSLVFLGRPRQQGNKLFSFEKGIIPRFLPKLAHVAVTCGANDVAYAAEREKSARESIAYELSREGSDDSNGAVPLPKGAHSAFHQKYRPMKFSELRGQTKIAKALAAAVMTGRVAPAYIFSGPRGTGKTSSARILAAAVNCERRAEMRGEPCGQCKHCLEVAAGSSLDVREVDAASHSGVEHMRSLTSSVSLLPASARMRVFILDEAHMLTVEASNAFLKTLEQPPPHVLFVLSTSEPARLPATVLSRCAQFSFRRIPDADVERSLRDLAAREQLDVDDDALSLMVKMADGALRDAAVLLEQVSLLSGRITAQVVQQLAGVSPTDDVEALLHGVLEGDAGQTLARARSLLAAGVEPSTLVAEMASLIMEKLVASPAPLPAVTIPGTRVMPGDHKDSDAFATASESAAPPARVPVPAHDYQPELLHAALAELTALEARLRSCSSPRIWLEAGLTKLARSVPGGTGVEAPGKGGHDAAKEASAGHGQGAANRPVGSGAVAVGGNFRASSALVPTVQQEPPRSPPVARTDKVGSAAAMRNASRVTRREQVASKQQQGASRRKQVPDQRYQGAGMQEQVPSKRFQGDATGRAGPPVMDVPVRGDEDYLSQASLRGARVPASVDAEIGQPTGDDYFWQGGPASGSMDPEILRATSGRGDFTDRSCSMLRGKECLEVNGGNRTGEGSGEQGADAGANVTAQEGSPMPRGWVTSQVGAEEVVGSSSHQPVGSSGALGGNGAAVALPGDVCRHCWRQTLKRLRKAPGALFEKHAQLDGCERTPDGALAVRVHWDSEGTAEHSLRHRGKFEQALKEQLASALVSFTRLDVSYETRPLGSGRDRDESAESPEAAKSSADRFSSAPPSPHASHLPANKGWAPEEDAVLTAKPGISKEAPADDVASRAAMTGMAGQTVMPTPPSERETSTGPLSLSPAPAGIATPPSGMAAAGLTQDRSVVNTIPGQAPAAAAMAIDGWGSPATPWERAGQSMLNDVNNNNNAVALCRTPLSRIPSTKLEEISRKDTTRISNENATSARYAAAPRAPPAATSTLPSRMQSARTANDPSQGADAGSAALLALAEPSTLPAGIAEPDVLSSPEVSPSTKDLRKDLHNFYNQRASSKTGEPGIARHSARGNLSRSHVQSSPAEAAGEDIMRDVERAARYLADASKGDIIIE